MNSILNLNWKERNMDTQINTLEAEVAFCNQELYNRREKNRDCKFIDHDP